MMFVVGVIVITIMMGIVSRGVFPGISRSISTVIHIGSSSSEPMGAEETWMHNLFLPFEDTFPEEIAKKYPACSNLPVKNSVEAAARISEINKCILTVATALEVWKYVEQGIENPDFSYMKQYGIDEKKISELENLEKELVQKMKEIEGETDANVIKAKKVLISEELARKIDVVGD